MIKPLYATWWGPEEQPSECHLVAWIGQALESACGSITFRHQIELNQESHGRQRIENSKPALPVCSACQRNARKWAAKRGIEGDFPAFKAKPKEKVTAESAGEYSGRLTSEKFQLLRTLKFKDVKAADRAKAEKKRKLA